MLLQDKTSRIWSTAVWASFRMSLRDKVTHSPTCFGISPYTKTGSTSLLLSISAHLFSIIFSFSFLPGALNVEIAPSHVKPRTRIDQPRLEASVILSVSSPAVQRVAWVKPLGKQHTVPRAQSAASKQTFSHPTIASNASPNKGLMLTSTMKATGQFT